MPASARRPSLSLRASSVALALLAFAASARAQSVGRLEGTVIDSLRAASPLAGASVSATRVGAARETTLVAQTDAKGRFAFERIESFSENVMSAFVPDCVICRWL